MEESHTKQQIPKTVPETELQAKRSKSAVLGARTREWESNGDFFLEVEDDMGQRSEGTHVGTITNQGAPGLLACPGGLWSPRGPPHLSLHTTSSLTSRKNSPLLSLSLSRVLAPKPADFDLFARSSVSKTVSGDCCLVCDSPVSPISFCFSGLYFE